LHFAPDSERVKTAISMQSPRKASTETKIPNRPILVSEAVQNADRSANSLPAPSIATVQSPAEAEKLKMHISAEFEKQNELIKRCHEEVMQKMAALSRVPDLNAHKGMPQEAILKMRMAAIEANVLEIKAHQKRKREEEEEVDESDSESESSSSSSEEEEICVVPAKIVYYYPPQIVAQTKEVCVQPVPLCDEIVSDDIVAGPVFDDEDEVCMEVPVHITLKMYSMSADFELEHSTPRTNADYYIVPEDEHGINLLGVFQNIETCKRVLESRSLVISEAMVRRCVQQAAKGLGQVDDLLRQSVLRHNANQKHKLPLGNLPDDTKIRNVFSEFQLSKRKTAKNITICDSITQNTRAALLNLFDC
jgi:hypothetical protein